MHRDWLLGLFVLFFFGGNTGFSNLENYSHWHHINMLFSIACEISLTPVGIFVNL